MELTASGFASFSGMATFTASAEVTSISSFAGIEDSIASSDDFSARLGTHDDSSISESAFFKRLPSIVVNGLLGKLIVNQAYPWLNKAWDAASPHLHHALAWIINRWSDH